MFCIIFSFTLFLHLLSAELYDDLSENEKKSIKISRRGLHSCVLADSYISTILPRKELLCVFNPPISVYKKLNNDKNDLLNIFKDYIQIFGNECDWLFYVPQEQDNYNICDSISKLFDINIILNNQQQKKGLLLSKVCDNKANFDSILRQYIKDYKRVLYLQGTIRFDKDLFEDIPMDVIECGYWPVSSPLMINIVPPDTTTTVTSTASKFTNMILASETTGNMNLDGAIFDACFLSWLLTGAFDNSGINTDTDTDTTSSHHSSTSTILEYYLMSSSTTICNMASAFWSENYRGVLRYPYQYSPCSLVHVSGVTIDKSAIVEAYTSYLESDSIVKGLHNIVAAYPLWTDTKNGRKAQVCCKKIRSVRYLRACKSYLNKSDNITMTTSSVTMTETDAVNVRDQVRSIMNQKRKNKKMTSIYALFFPQFHKYILNDYLWGKGFTDWKALKSAPSMNRLKKPILRPTEMLGEYDLITYKTRKMQASLAKKYGVDGFIYHHYWFFTNKSHPLYNKKDDAYNDISTRNSSLYYPQSCNAPLSTPLMKMLEDGEPNTKFAFNWANNDWIATWQGKSNAVDGDLLLKQNYPDAANEQVLLHYRYLSQFFKKDNYIKVRNAPLLLVYTDHKAIHKNLHAILRKYRELAMADGFSGLHIPSPKINTHHPTTVRRYATSKSKYHSDLKYINLHDGFDADLYYPGQHTHENSALPLYCHAGIRDKQKRPEYVGLVTTFDNTPRRKYAAAKVWNRFNDYHRAPLSFENDLFDILIYDKCCQNSRSRLRGGRFVLVNAWNEWGEGMALEPSVTYNMSFLAAIKNAKLRAQQIICPVGKVNNKQSVSAGSRSKKNKE